MNCNEFNSYLDRDLSGALSADDRARMERHAEACPDCAQQLRAHRMIRAAFEATEPVRAPQSLADRIRSQIAAETAGEVVPFTQKPAAPITMDCESFETHAAAFTDGMLSGALAAAMTEHRTACTSCDRLAQAHETVAAAFAATEPVTAPAGLADRIRAAAYETEAAPEPIRAASPFRRFNLFAAAAALVSIISGGLLVTTLRNPGTVTSGTFFQTLDAGLFRITMLPALFEAWVARMIPAEQWIVIARLLEPVELPYLPFEFSRMFYFAAGIGMVLTWGLTWRVLRSPMPLKQRF